MTYHLRLLHVSDIAAAPAASRGDRRSGSRWQDPLDQLDPLRGKGGVDLVCYAGGAAGPEGGAVPPEEPAFLQPLLDRLGLGGDRLLAVPRSRPPVTPPASGNQDRSCLGFRREVRLDRLPFGVQVIAFDSDVASGTAWRAGGGDDLREVSVSPRGEPTAGPGGHRIACQLITVTCDAAGRPERLILRLRGSTPVDARGGRTAAPEVAFREALPRPAND